MEKTSAFQATALTGHIRHVLHGTWLVDQKQFALWGEDISITATRQKGKRGPHTRHPFALSQEHMLRYLDLYSTDSEPDGRPIQIWLPGLDKDVQPSPEAERGGKEAPAGDLDLLSWHVDSIILSATDALDFLVQLPDAEQPTGGLALGSDVAFWQQAALLVMQCLVEQQYLPALEQQGSRYLASWLPQIADEDLSKMAAGMPPLCRAVTNSPTEAHPARALLDHFLRTVLDSTIRAMYGSSRMRASSNAWIKALTGKSNILPGLPRDQAKLFEAWQAWHSPLGTGAASEPFKVCFRLSEPAEGQENWSLDYLLQATDDPSLLVEAAQVWTARGRTLRYLERRFEHPQEKLLTALGLAGRIFPPITRSLQESSPVGVMLNTEEAFTFLTDAAPLLEQNRLGVLVPNWWAKRTAALKVKAKVKGKAQETNGLLRLDTLLNYQWEVSLGGQSVNRKEFEQLVALKQPLVRYRGQWIALSPDQIQAALAFLKKQASDGDMTLLDALKSAQEGAQIAPGLEVEAVQFEGKLKDLFKRLRDPARIKPPRIPAALHATLRPYQERGFGWLAQMQQLGLGACLADDMGLGKTITTITLWLHQKVNKQLDRPALLICPTSVVGNWRHELTRFAPDLRVFTHHGAGRLSGKAFAKAIKEFDVVLTSYALLTRDVETLKAIRWSSVTLDEAQNIKNAETKQAQAARALEADFRMALTGTPVENRLTELWSILTFLNSGYLGSRESFRSQFSLPIERYRDAEAAARLKSLTAPLILRRLKTDPKIINDLPEKFENKVFCSLTPEQATLYEAVVREEIEAIENAESAMDRRGAVLRMLIRLKQICNHPAQFLKEGHGQALLSGRSGKLSRLTEMLEEVLSTGDRALIFTQYAEMGTYLQMYLQEQAGSEVLFLHGGTPAKRREAMVKQFQSPNGPALFILSLKAGGTGLNLTHANNVFHYDRWYNPAVENQATDRAFRIGQTHNVQVHKFICLGTLEERIDEMIESKKNLAEQIVGEGEGWISEMSTDELRALVTLRREMVEEI